MKYWRFLDYRTKEGLTLIVDWYNGQDIEVQVAFDVVLSILAGTRNWDDPDLYEFKEFKTGKYVGLSEVKFSVDQGGKKRIFRPIGIWRPDSQEFILILGCEKSGRIKIPSDAFDLALRYKAEFEDGKGSVHEHI
jgi:hypothetical protein